MIQPKTIYDVLVMLADYYQQRVKQYAELGSSSRDSQAQILLEHMVELEEHSFQVIRAEMNDLSPEHSTYLTLGPVLSESAMHAVDGQCSAEPSFEEALDCVFTSDQFLDEFIARIETGGASFAVAGLATRLRDLEGTKRRQIANFTRLD